MDINLSILMVICICKSTTVPFLLCLNDKLYELWSNVRECNIMQLFANFIALLKNVILLISEPVLLTCMSGFKRIWEVWNFLNSQLKKLDF